MKRTNTPQTTHTRLITVLLPRETRKVMKLPSFVCELKRLIKELRLPAIAETLQKYKILKRWRGPFNHRPRQSTVYQSPARENVTLSRMA